MRNFPNRLCNSLILVALLTAAGCGGSVLKRLNPSEVDHYTALRVWMDDDDTKAYKKLKTEDERNEFLKGRGYWSRFYQYPDKTRDEILAGAVEEGWKQDMVYMAWGAPHQKMVLPGRRASRSVQMVYRFEVDAEGRVMVWAPKSKATYSAIDKYQLELIVDDGIVMEIRKKDHWE